MDNNAYVQLPTAYRSLSRPSSALDAKAFPLRSLQLDLTGTLLCLSLFRDFGSLKNYAGLRFGYIVVCVTLLLKFHNLNFVTSLLLARNFLLASLFSFQGADSNLFQGQIEMLKPLPKHFNPPSLKVVGPSGLEPPTSRLSVVRSSQLSYGPIFGLSPSSLEYALSTL